jgi:hypothetical protein
MTVYARGAAAGIPVDQMMTFVGHRDIRTAMRHYRDPNCLDTQRIAARLAGEETITDSPVVQVRDGSVGQASTTVRVGRRSATGTGAGLPKEAR